MSVPGPVHCSVAADCGGPSPPKAKAAVFVAPSPPKLFLAVDKSPLSVQLVPFQISVTATLAVPL